MPKQARHYTNTILNAADDGMLSWEYIARCALGYMSEDDVAGMYEANNMGPCLKDFGIDEDDEDTNEDDGAE